MIFQIADPILDETLLNAARNEKTGGPTSEGVKTIRGAHRRGGARRRCR